MSDNTKVADLLPCPFCGPGESIVACCFDDVANRYRVYCGRCGSSTGIHPTDRTEAPAIAAWNRRAALARKEADIAALRSAPAAAGVPTMSNVGLRKLSELQAQGYVVNGVSIIDPESSKRGLIDSLGYVGWHTPEQQAAQAVVLLRRAIPYLRDEGSKYDDDGSNEPLELAREIESLVDQQAGKGVDRE